LYGYETWFLAQKEEHRLRVFENTVLRRMAGYQRKKEGKKRNRMMNKIVCCSSPNIRVMK
jgi:hypothetical protein